jgi:hypothetical protein
MVVNKSSVGKKDISSTSFTYSTLNKTMSAIDRLRASITSSKKDGIGIIKKITAASKYKPTPTSSFLIDKFIPAALLSQLYTHE